MAVTKPSDRQPAGADSASEAGDRAEAETTAADTRADAAPATGTEADRARFQADHARSQRDHDAINRLADDLLPALIARLSSSGLGEIEVREGGWKARLRKPVGRAPLPRPEHQTLAPARATVHRDDRRAAEATPEEELGVVVAKSPAVGVYTPRRDLVMGMRVRSGDRIGVVDVLGVQQDVLSPIEGVIGSSLAEAGEAVEYGQELVRIETGETAAAAQRPTPGQKASAPVGSAS